MKIEKITVSAGRTFNHPFESYSNLRPEVHLVASVEDGDDPEKCAKELQAKAESLVEDHKQNMLRSLEMIREMDIRNREMARLGSLIKTSQEALERYRGNPIGEKPPLDFFGPAAEENCPDCEQFPCVCERE